MSREEKFKPSAHYRFNKQKKQIDLVMDILQETL